jgi:hypothetical protein
MSMIDNTIAGQMPQYDASAPLVQAAKLQAADQEMQQAKFKQNQIEMGSEMRGIAPFVNTPEFPAKWAEAADRLRQRGVIDDQMHQQWANNPSPLLMKSIIAKTEDPNLSFRKEEAQREQKNQDRSTGYSVAATCTEQARGGSCRSNTARGYAGAGGSGRSSRPRTGFTGIHVLCARTIKGGSTAR